MKILYCDQNIAVCIKQVNMDSEKQVPEALAGELGGEIFTVHRLDKNVGGVMVYARNQKTAAQLSAGIRDGLMVKEYLALVHGTPPQSGIWEDLLFKDSTKNKVYVVKRKRAGVKAAKLEFDCLTRDERSLVHIRLHTGRSHQIRVQFASRGFALVGDRKYGAKDKATAPMLHSFRITFSYGGKTFMFEDTPAWAKLG